LGCSINTMVDKLPPGSSRGVLNCAAAVAFVQIGDRPFAALSSAGKGFVLYNRLVCERYHNV
jgi:hypothetical protein